MQKTKKDFFIKTLGEMYPNAETELNYETPFQLLCAVMRSAQTTDKQVNKATKKLFGEMKNAQNMLELGEEKVREHINTLGFFNNKAKNALLTAKIIDEKYAGKIPDTIEELTALPGVGIKTAKVVLSVLYDQSFLAVDTHVHRVLNRLNFVDTKLPEQTDKQLDKIFSSEDKKKLHHQLILFGRYFCKAKKPECEAPCPFQNTCKYYYQKWN